MKKEDENTLTISSTNLHAVLENKVNLQIHLSKTHIPSIRLTYDLPPNYLCLSLVIAFLQRSPAALLQLFPRHCVSIYASFSQPKET